MSQYDPQKKEAILAARKADKEEKARKTLEKYNTGKNTGMADKTINKFAENPIVKKAVKERSEKMQDFKDLKNKGSRLKTIGNIAKNATPWGLLGIMSQGKLKDFPYFLALIAAVLKDIFDLMEVTGIGYAAVIVFTFLCGIWIAMMMLLAGGFEGRRKQKIISSWLILLSGTTVEMIFGLDILPIETLTVCIIYFLLLADRKQAAEEKASA